jgi:hypothetical protein
MAALRAADDAAEREYADALAAAEKAEDTPNEE